MKKISEDVLKVYFIVCDMKKCMEICRCGLESMRNEEALSMIGVYKVLLEDAEKRLSHILEYVDEKDCS